MDLEQQTYTKEIMMLMMKHPIIGLIKEVPTGFSWTTFFFGFFVPLIRGEYAHAAILFIASAFTFGLAGIVGAFIINKLYAQSLLLKGYVPNSEQDILMLNMQGIAYADNKKQALKAA